MEIPFEDKVRAGDRVARMIVEARLHVLEEDLERGTFPNGKRLTAADRTDTAAEVEIIRELLGVETQPVIIATDTAMQLKLWD